MFECGTNPLWYVGTYWSIWSYDQDSSIFKIAWWCIRRSIKLHPPSDNDQNKVDRGTSPRALLLYFGKSTGACRGRSMASSLWRIVTSPRLFQTWPSDENKSPPRYKPRPLASSPTELANEAVGILQQHYTPDMQIQQGQTEVAVLSISSKHPYSKNIIVQLQWHIWNT